MQSLFENLEEHNDPIQAKVTGTIPDWVEGSLYRNGPGKFEFGDTKVNHWFDGMALLHRFHIHRGQVTYHSKFLESQDYLTNKAANRFIVPGFGTVAYPDPCKSFFQRIFSYFEPPSPTDNTVVNILPLGKSIYAATETKYLQRIDPDTLDTVQRVDLSEIMGIRSATAHPHWDPQGAIHNLGAMVKEGYKYTIIKLTPSNKDSKEDAIEKADVIASVPAQWRMHPSYTHSFGMSENYYVILEQPLVLNVLKLMTSNLRGKPFADSMEWYPKEKTRFILIDRRTGERVNPEYDYLAEGFFAFHHANTYEENGNLVVDLCCFTDMSVFMSYNFEHLWNEDLDDFMRKLQKPENRRYVLPLKLDNNVQTDKNLVTLEYTTATAKVDNEKKVLCTFDLLCKTGLDFPQYNYRKYNMKKYRYLFGVGYIDKQLDAIMKIDTKTRTHIVWQEQGYYPSEAVFVANPHGQDEDDGVLLSVVLNTGPNRKAFLLVLDARDLKELARATVDVRIGMGTHGTFVGPVNNNSAHTVP